MKNFSIILAVLLIISCSDDNEISEMPSKPVSAPLIQWYVDGDKDSFGNPDKNLGRMMATQPEGFVRDNTDCDDNDITIHPSALEDDYDGIDSNCDGKKENIIITFSKTFDRQMGSDTSTNIIKTRDGGYLVLGNTMLSTVEDFVGGNSIWLLKFDTEGNLEWNNLYGGLEKDFGTEVIQTTDGGYLVSGSSKSSQGTASSNAGDFDWLLFKINATGNIEWTKTFGGSKLDGISDILETKSGNYLIMGGSWSSDGDFTRSDNNSSAWFFMLSPNGDLIWKTHLDGGTPRNVLELENGHFFALGDIFTTGTASELRIWTLNPTGEITFTKDFNPGGHLQTRITDMLLDINGNILASGGVSIDYKNDDGMLLNITRDGDINWMKLIGGVGRDAVNSITLAQDGSSFATGRIRSKESQSADIWLSKYDSNGNQLWENQLGGSNSEIAGDLLILDDESLIILASTLSKDGPIVDKNEENDSFDLWLLKFKLNVLF